MEFWKILLGFLGVLLLIAFLLREDNKWKHRKTIKKNKLSAYTAGYMILPAEKEKRTVLLLEGVLGVNGEELVFEHRFQNDVFPDRVKLSEISSVGVSSYSEDAFSSFVLKEGGSGVRYLVRNMIGVSVSRHTPRLVKSRTLCRITLNDGSKPFFCFKDAEESREVVARIGRNLI